MFSAISFGVLRRCGALDQRDHPVQERVPGLLGDLDHDPVRQVTRVPPVTALRSPPDSRITGADSPVIADSSTDAIPSITVPSPGISSPASTTTTSPLASSEACLVVPSFSLRDRLLAHRAQRVGLRAAAALGERLGHVREHDGQPQPERDHERVPRRLVTAAERLAAEHLDEPGHGRDHRADLDDEHHRVADLHARVELEEAVDQRAPDDVRAGTARSRGARMARVPGRVSTADISGPSGQVGRARG